MRNQITNTKYSNYDYISRYSNFPEYYDETDDVWFRGTSSQLSSETSYQSYTVKRNDTYDSIALKFYNNPTYYWIICDYNRISDSFTRPEEGTLLKIPTFSSITFMVN